MRFTQLFLTCLLSFQLQGGDFTIFEEEGYYGIKDENGQVSVPAVYEFLGWPDHIPEIHAGVIGYKEGNQWGLITTKNKIITPAKYYSITPFGESRFKASVKGKFSNQLFYGIINQKGKTEVSFNYFSIDALEGNLLVTVFENNGRHFGLISYENEQVIPAVYERITLNNDSFYARKKDKKIDLYNQDGTLIGTSLDSIRKEIDGMILFRNGYAGFIRNNGQIVHDFKYKEFIKKKGKYVPLAFPKWVTYQGDEILFQTFADSIQLNSGGLWEKHVNGAHHIVLLDSTIQIQDALIKDVTEKHYIFKDIRSEDWYAVEKKGEKVLDGYDSIYATDFVLWAKENSSWRVYNRYGKSKNQFNYEGIHPGVNGQVILIKNSYKGLADQIGQEITRLKYEEMIPINDVYKVKYLNRWGIMGQRGQWIVRPAFDEVFIRNQMYIGRNGGGYTYHGLNGFNAINTFKPLEDIGDRLLIMNEDSLVGVIDRSARIIIYPAYDELNYWNGYYEAKDENGVSLLDLEGNQIISPDEEVQSISGFGEGYFLIKKNNRWGFTDTQGRLRISNRYDDAKPFRESMAAIHIRGKWGFIDKQETLVVQPFYEYVSEFNDGLCVVTSDGQYGLINRSGEQVVEPAWANIKRLPTGNYLVKDDNEYVGLISSSGRFLLRPRYTALQDCGGMVIISQESGKGVVNYEGKQLFRTTYKEILVSNDFTILKH